MSKSHKQMAAELTEVFRRIGLPATKTHSPALWSLGLLLGDGARRHHGDPFGPPEQYTGPHKTSLYDRIKTSAAYRYLQAGTDASKVQTEDLKAAASEVSASAVHRNTHADLDAIRAEVSKLKARNSALEANALHMQEELRRREEELVKLGQEIDEADTKVGQLSHSLKEANEASASATLAGMEISTERNRLRTELDEAKHYTRQLKANLLAARTENARLLDLMTVIRKAVKLAKA